MSTLPPAGSLPIWCASTLSSISIWLEGLGAALLALALVWMVAAARAQRRELEASEGAEQRFLDALQSNPEPVIVVRLADDRILAVNEAFERINGRSRQEVIGRTPHDLRLWPVAEQRERFIAQLREHGAVHDLIYDLCAADGVARPHRVAAMLLELAGGTCLLATAKNIEEEEQALEELRLAEQRFATAFRSSPEAMTIATLPDARILEANPSFLELSGYPYDEVIGRTALELGIWEDPEERARLFGALTEGRPVRDVELRFRRRDGERLWTRFSLSLVELDGELCILPMGRDITPMRRLEEEREALIRKLEMRRAELGQFSYSISHDLRTPMVTISGFLGMLERHAAEGDRPAMHRDLDHLRSAANHLGALLDDLRDLSEAGRGLGEITEVDLGALARESIIALERRLERRAVEVEISTDLPKVRGDRRRLRQVFDHLLSNAIKFLGEQEHPRIEIGARAAPGGGGRAEVYVRDNGVGIAPRYQEKIFGLFQRLDPSVEGTGLGLALVARLIELHGGGIRAESAGLGHGSTMIWTVDGSNHRISGDVPRGEG